MPSRSQAVPFDTLREALLQRVKESSLRAAAQEVGMSWKAVDKIISGQVSSHPATVNKLTEWYLRRQAAVGEEPRPETASAALAILTWHVPPGRKGDVQERILSAIREELAADGANPPGWLEESGAGSE